MRARVIVLAGPSGAGKSVLAARTKLPILRLDDFYKNGSDPTLPRITQGANAGLVDWDHADSWVLTDALAAITDLCVHGRAVVPVYDIAKNGRDGERVVDLEDHRAFVAEGIFAQEVVPATTAARQLAAAYCVTQPPPLTFVRRLARDLRERRKPPLVLLRRGLALLRDQPHVVAHARALGCQVVTPDEAMTRIRHLMAIRGPAADAGAVGPGVGAAVRGGLPQPDQRSCGAAVLVVARTLGDPAESSDPGDPVAAPDDESFAADVLATHRQVTRIVTGRGRAQVPWPRPLGTPPWAVTRRRAADSAVPHSVHVVRRGPRGPAYDAVLAALRAGLPVPLYVGSRLLPRHVVLAVDGTERRLRLYDPARGGTRFLTREEWTGDFQVGRWRRLWFVVLPAQAGVSPRRGRRTRV